MLSLFSLLRSFSQQTSIQYYQLWSPCFQSDLHILFIFYYWVYWSNTGQHNYTGLRYTISQDIIYVLYRVLTTQSQVCLCHYLSPHTLLCIHHISSYNLHTIVLCSWVFFSLFLNSSTHFQLPSPPPTTVVSLLSSSYSWKFVFFFLREVLQDQPETKS